MLEFPNCFRESTDPQRKSSAPWHQPLAGVAFDMDGLMLNTEELYFEVGQIILQRRGKHYSNSLRRAMMGLPGTKAAELMIATESLSDSPESILAEYDEVFVSLLPQRIAAMPGLLDLLHYLRGRNIPRCVATSSRLQLAEHSLSLIGVLDQLDFIVTSADVRHGKPSPDIYLLAAKRMNVEPSAMLVLEDSQHGCRAGVASGACTVAVPGDHSRDHDFSGTWFIADSLEDHRIFDLLASR